MTRNDELTIAAIALAAMCLVTFAHEALGHGSVCVGLGGHIVELTSAVFHCDRQSPWLAPAGPASNLAVGTCALLLGRWLRPRRADLELFLMLVTSFSFFWEAGYAIHAMHRRDGDLYFAGQDFFGEPSLGWRITGATFGAALFACTALWAWRTLSALCPDRRDMRLVGRVAWFAASLGAVLAALPFALEHAGATGSSDVSDAALEIGGTSFPLLWNPWHAPSRAGQRAPGSIARSYPTIAAALFVYVVFVATLGRGIGS
jgi:hypothetical protein